MIRPIFLSFAALCLPLFGATQVMAQSKVAVIIGNSEYDDAPLVNPRSDAGLLAATLTELEFDVTLYYDVTRAQIPLLKEKIETSLADADIGILYYAGHGLQYKDQNMLLPVDADLTSVEGVAEGGLTLSEMLQSVTINETGIKIVILDACRNPLIEGDSTDLKPGFSFQEAPRGEILVAFSTGSGEVAFDSTGGGNSPYTTALANALQRPDADIYDTFRAVRGSVRSATGGKQIPWITGSIESDYVFRASTNNIVTPSGATAPPIDEVLWEFLQTSIDQRDAELFLQAFPNSRFAEDAANLQNIQLAQAEGEILSRDGVDLSAQDISREVADDPSTAPDQGGRQTPILDQSGEYILRDAFRIWPIEIAPTESGLSSLATQCDEEAADPVDPNKLSPGVSAGVMDIRRALRSCAFELATDPENPRLLFQFARTLDQVRRYEWANAFYEKAIAQGYSAAMVNRGFNARLGRGSERDLELSATLYRQAALLGNPRGRTNLGGAYLNGRGVEKSVEEGILWLRLAASMGWPHATNALGDAYWAGRGLPKDRAEAVNLYRSAAEQGQTTGLANLGRAYVLGQGVPLDTVRGLAILEQSLALGNGFAALHAGRFYMRGNEEVAADPARALTMFQAGTRRGARAGYLEMARGYEQGIFDGGVNIEQALRSALFAQRARVRGTDEVLEAIKSKMDPDAVVAIEADVQQFIRLNGL
jgi:TPR repeat protein